MSREDELFDLLWRALHAMGQQVHAAAAEQELTPMQAMLLDRLRDDVAVPMTELAGQLHCDKSNLTGIVDALEARGLVERTTPAQDRRVRALAPTPAGRTARAELARRLRRDNPLLGALREEDRRSLAAILARMTRD